MMVRQGTDLAARGMQGKVLALALVLDTLRVDMRKDIAVASLSAADTASG